MRCISRPMSAAGWGAVAVRVWSFGSGSRVGQAEAEVVTRKNLIVRLEAPRFFVQKDEVVLSTIVHNYTKTSQRVRVEMRLPTAQFALLSPDNNVSNDTHF